MEVKASSLQTINLRFVAFTFLIRTPRLQAVGCEEIFLLFTTNFKPRSLSTTRFGEFSAKIFEINLRSLNICSRLVKRLETSAKKQSKQSFRWKGKPNILLVLRWNKSRIKVSIANEMKRLQVELSTRIVIDFRFSLSPLSLQYQFLRSHNLFNDTLHAHRAEPRMRVAWIYLEFYEDLLESRFFLGLFRSIKLSIKRK